MSAAQATARLAGIDSLRGLAAVWVVVYHVYVFSGVRGNPVVEATAGRGYLGVSLFLVLSGFCIWLPFARGRTFAAAAFWRRRAGRLLPTYYVAVGAAFALNLLGGSRIGLIDLGPREALTQAVMHASFTYVVFGHGISISPSTWSLDLEWQLYLAFPLAVLAARRFGVARVAAAGVLMSAVYLLAVAAAGSSGLIPDPYAANLPNQFPGRAGEFALGMLAAELLARNALPVALTRAWPFALPVLGLLLVVPAGPLLPVITGAGFFLLLLMVLAADGRVANAMARPALVAVGAVSYSLYLVQQPVVMMWCHLLRAGFGLEGAAAFFLGLLAVPLALAAGWLLFLAVERRGCWTVPASGSRRLDAALRVGAPRPVRRVQPELA